jgi:hypothetical protein
MRNHVKRGVEGTASERGETLNPMNPTQEPAVGKAQGQNEVRCCEGVPKRICFVVRL